MEKIVTLEEALKRIAELEKEKMCIRDRHYRVQAFAWITRPDM